MSKTLHSILCVCLGNICCSPLTDGIARELALQNHITLKVDSAGTSRTLIHFAHSCNDNPPVIARQSIATEAHVRSLELTCKSINLACHTEQSEVSHNMASNGDISGLSPRTSKALALTSKYDNVDSMNCSNVDCHEFDKSNSRNDEVATMTKRIDCHGDSRLAMTAETCHYLSVAKHLDKIIEIFLLRLKMAKLHKL